MLSTAKRVGPSRWLLAAALGLSFSTNVLAAEDVVESCTAKDCAEVGQWQFGLALGHGLTESPVVGEEDNRFPLLPRVSYYGERFFIETQTLGFTLAESPAWRLNLIAFPNLDYGYFSQGNALRNGLVPPTSLPMAFTGEFDIQTGEIIAAPVALPPELSERRLTYLGGLELSAFYGSWALQLRAGRDISVGHDGRQLDFSLKRHDDLAGSSVDTAIGVMYRDGKLSDYYFGLDASESHSPFFTYTPQSSYSPYLIATLHHPLTEQLGLLVWLSAQRAGSAIADSPVIERSWFCSRFFGLTYDF